MSQLVEEMRSVQQFLAFVDGAPSFWDDRAGFLPVTENLVAVEDDIAYSRCRYAMKTTIQKWGNSLAVRIPRPFAEEIGLEESSAVDLTIRAGKLVVAPIEREITLEALVEQVTDENRHDAIESGRRLGKEIW